MFTRVCTDFARAISRAATNSSTRSVPRRESGRSTASEPRCTGTTANYNRASSWSYRASTGAWGTRRSRGGHFTRGDGYSDVKPSAW